MGAEIDRAEFAPADYQRFKERLPGQIAALEALLARDGFGRRERSIGAELELFLIDAQARPLPICLDVLEDVRGADASAEIDHFEIELATSPVLLRGRPFGRLAADLARQRAAVDAAARAHGARTVAFGVLPTLVRSDLTPAAITPRPRYRALTRALRERRGAPFRIDIAGDDPLRLDWDSAALEGANTAFQLHLQAAPDEFSALFNAAQLAIAPVLAASGNSPTFLGHRLWEETRVALFKQAGDVRSPDAVNGWRAPSRIGFGTGWMRDGAAEQFRESVALHEPLLPVVGDEDEAACVAQGGVPKLAELRLHHGTVWYWNRAVYDPTDDGHLRIEMRALPAGPTDADMVANAALLIGLVLDLAPTVGEILPAFPFAWAEHNFYQAARHGLAAELMWPTDPCSAPAPVTARRLLPSLLERARRGLVAAGVDSADATAALDVLAARVATGVTGARWQRLALAALEQSGGRDRSAALAEMVQRYVAHAATGKPVHAWPLPS